MKYLPVNPRLFITNRKRFMDRMLPMSIAIFHSNDEMPTNGDALYPFRQNSDLYWLCGIEQEDTMLILFPDHPDPRYREVLVLTRPEPLKEKWDGHRLRADEAHKISGIQTVIWLDQIEGLLQAWIHLADHIYVNTNENDRKRSWLPTRDYRYAEELRRKYPAHDFQRSARILARLRAVKTVDEIELMRIAIDITHKAFLRVLQFIRPGVMEYEIEAEIWHEFLRNRATGPAYSSIIASGDRARVLHYVFNNQECKDGELVLMDFGAEYARYCADLTRTVPVNGRFTARQKELYNTCLQLQRYAISLLKPGITIQHYHELLGDEATRLFLKVGLLKESDVKNEDPENRAYQKYLYHGISHFLGIDVHDLGSKTEPLIPGMVLTVEPGIYVEEEQIGIRIENNVLITEKGNIDLMQQIPVEADDIERLMRK
ncbi:MAG: aminopeptidase P family protein [Thermoflavifilum sp.]|uniref:aminopeptidase P family protein n=1 Tax=Thermoflavifilum sp. TaxID=1968839 RepID=UPI0018A4B8FA|nr:aminopeptidase P family protein [Thermoflavifilum sp.]QOR76185.1 MAG: aminopeptidase P family protein [Thermoflavifilum sp.]